jgi:serine/threonine protein kinase
MTRRLGTRFELLARLGGGVSAEVFRARDLASDREVALKLLRPEVARDADTVERLRREVLALAAVASPHVVGVHELHTVDGDVFMTMEHIAGPTLRDLLGNAVWSRDALHVLVGQLAHVVAAIHERGILHRDLKPENIMLPRGSHGRHVKVIDFGLAKLVDLATLTATGHSFGTPQYMSPEQMQGDAASRASDLWALAVIAFEVISGALPWDGKDARDVYFAQSTKPLPALPSTIERHAALDAFFAQALAKDPAGRFATASDLFAAFEQAMFGGPRATDHVFDGVVGMDFAISIPAAEADIATDETLLGAETQPGAETVANRRRS